MSQKLSVREKRLLFLCLAAVFLVGNLFAFREFNVRHKALKTELADLQEQVTTNRILLSDKEFWEKRSNWLDKNMPYTASAGRAQGQLLEALQTSALDHELTVSNQTLLEPLALEHGNEVAVSLRVRGDQEKMMRWLLTLQSPEKFQAIKSFDMELDTRAQETTPQAQCNLTVARWFNPNPPPVATNTAPAIIPTTPETSTSLSTEEKDDSDDEPVNPLAPSDPLGGF